MRDIEKHFKKLLIFGLLACYMTVSVTPAFSITGAEAENSHLQMQTETQDEPVDIDSFDQGTRFISEIKVLGNNLIAENQIKDYMNIKEGSVYDRADIAQDLTNIFKSGYFTTRMSAYPEKLSDDTVRLIVRVEENPMVTDFTVTGNTVIPWNEIMRLLVPLEGQPQNINRINESIDMISELYTSKGYILAGIEGIDDDPDGCLNIYINEGTIGDIRVEGNHKTKDFVVKRNILVEPGMVYNENIVRSDIMRLMGTQSYKDVKRTIDYDEASDTYLVTINLEEQRTATFSLGAGIDSGSGFFGSVGFGENNFRGLGQKLSANFMMGSGILMSDSSVLRRANTQAEISFLEPHFKSKENSLGIRAYFRDFASFQVPLAIEQRFGAELSLSRRFPTQKNLTGGVSLSVENVNLKEGDLGQIVSLYDAHKIPISQRDEQLRGGTFLTVSPTLVYDTRDNLVNPRRGIYASVRMDEALNIADTENSYGKITATLRKFLPLGKKSSIVLTAKGGGQINGNIPEFMAFRLGGPYTIRGFNVAEVGTGNGMMMGSAEVRVPIPFIERLTSNSFINNIRIAGFVDAGTVFNKTITDTIYDRPGYAVSAGAGLRIFVPGIGPINLDYGFPITNVGSSGRQSGFFTFGIGESFY